MATNNTAGLTYAWYRNGVVIPGANIYWYSANQAGSYTAAISNGGCTSVSPPIVVSWCATGMALEDSGVPDEREGIQEDVEETGATRIAEMGMTVPALNVFPNPTTGVINVLINDPEAVVVEISDLTGRRVMRARYTTTLDVSILPMGAYVVVIRSFDGKPLAHGRFVRE